MSDARNHQTLPLYDPESAARHSRRARIFDACLIVIATLAGVEAIWVFGANWYGTQRSATFAVLGGPGDGEYQSVATAMVKQFNDLSPKRAGPNSTNLAQVVNKWLFDPERTLKMDPAVVPTGGSDSNVRLIAKPSLYPLEQRIRSIKDPGFQSTAQDPRYTNVTIHSKIGFCQDQLVRDNSGNTQSDFNDLRALTPAFTSNLYIFVRKPAGGESMEFADLLKQARTPGTSPKTHQILFGSVGSYQAFNLTLRQYLPLDQKAPDSDVYLRLASMTKAFHDGYADNARAVSEGKALACVALVGIEAEFLHTRLPANLELVSIDRCDGVVQGKFGYTAVTIAAGSIPSADLFPREDVTTLGAPEILACNADLPDRDAYDIVRRLAMLPALNSLFTNVGAAWSSPESSTYIPMHPGALRFFRKQDAPGPIDATVLGFGATCLGSLWAKMKRRRIHEQIDKLDKIFEDLKSGTPGILVADIPRRVESVKYEAFSKLKFGLIDDSQYGCIEKYCEFANQVNATLPDHAAADVGRHREAAEGSDASQERPTVGTGTQPI